MTEDDRRPGSVPFQQPGGELDAVDLDLSVPSGQIYGFLGPNGAGKSTTMKMLTGFLSPTSGTAKVCGHDVLEDPMGVKRSIGYLPEDGGIDTSELDISDETMSALTSINADQWRAEIASIGEYLASYGERLPAALREEQEKVAKALAEAS